MASDCKKDITIYFTKSRKIFKKWQLHNDFKRSVAIYNLSMVCCQKKNHCNGLHFKLNMTFYVRHKKV